VVITVLSTPLGAIASSILLPSSWWFVDISILRVVLFLCCSIELEKKKAWRHSSDLTDIGVC